MSMLEREQNELLRRADWRFLLPDPAPTRSVCFAGGTLARAVGLISGTPLVSPAEATACDLAVAIDPSRATLQRAFAALRPGGAFYAEWSPRGTRSLHRVRQRLVEAGFVDIRCYWPWRLWPWSNRSQVLYWLPLDAPAVLEYFDRTLPVPHGRGRRLARTGRRALWRVTRLAQLTFPLCITAGKAPHSGDLETEGPLEWARAGWVDWGFGPPPQRLEWFLQTAGNRAVNKVVGLVFADGEAAPRLAVKMTRVAASAATLHREAAALRGLENSSACHVAGVPRALLVRERGDNLTLLETMVTGVPLFTRLGSADFAHFASLATDWLAALAGSPPLAARALWWDRLVATPVAAFVRDFGPVLDPELIGLTWRLLEPLEALPLVWEHRDFSPWNVMVDPTGSLAVLDWEGAESLGLPARDLHYFLTYLAFYRDGAMDSKKFRASYRALLDPTTTVGATALRCLERYARRVGFAESALRPLRVLTWIHHAQSEYRRLIGDAGGSPTPESLRGSLFLTLWEEELRLRTPLSVEGGFEKFRARRGEGDNVIDHHH